MQGNVKYMQAWMDAAITEKGEHKTWRYYAYFSKEIGCHDIEMINMNKLHYKLNRWQSRSESKVCYAFASTPVNLV